jgi:predicted metal-dependent hydrolase
LATQATTLAEELVVHCSGSIGAAPRVVRIRDLRSRWGSCSASRAISLNWRLILAPDGVFEYVVAHELCHLRHGGHGMAFWSLVRASVQDADERRKWLRDNQEWMMELLRDDHDGASEAQEGS